jgi:hypothetical protein
MPQKKPIRQESACVGFVFCLQFFNNTQPITPLGRNKNNMNGMY